MNSPMIRGCPNISLIGPPGQNSWLAADRKPQPIRLMRTRSDWSPIRAFAGSCKLEETALQRHPPLSSRAARPHGRRENQAVVQPNSTLTDAVAYRQVWVNLSRWAWPYEGRLTPRLRNFGLRQPRATGS